MLKRLYKFFSKDFKYGDYYLIYGTDDLCPQCSDDEPLRYFIATKSDNTWWSDSGKLIFCHKVIRYLYTDLD